MQTLAFSDAVNSDVAPEQRNEPNTSRRCVRTFSCRFRFKLPVRWRQRLERVQVQNDDDVIITHSLLWIYVPSSDRSVHWQVVPGGTVLLTSADTQVYVHDDEWTVDRALVKIRWDFGDVTPFLLYQIAFLQALTDYFELREISQISQLPQLGPRTASFRRSSNPFRIAHSL